MKPKNKCHKCGAAACCHLEHRKRWECESTATMGGFDQSSLCKERVKVARLKKQVAALKANRDEWEAEAMRRTHSETPTSEVKIRRQNYVQ